MLRKQKIAWGLGLSGLLPFVLPVLVVLFVSELTRDALETMQFAYAGIIIIFMGGVQWGYAVKQGEGAKAIQYVFSIMPALIIFGLLSFLPLFKPYQITVLFAVMLIGQMIFDYKTITETWFIKLRWVLTCVASLSLIMMALLQYYI